MLAGSHEHAIFITGKAAIFHRDERQNIITGRANSRVAEAEADKIGIELAARAGYDPAAAATLWRKMGSLNENTLPEFLSTHPASDNREQALRALAPAMMKYYEAPGVRPVYPMKNQDISNRPTTKRNQP